MYSVHTFIVNCEFQNAKPGRCDELAVILPRGLASSALYSLFTAHCSLLTFIAENCIRSAYVVSKHRHDVFCHTRCFDGNGCHDPSGAQHGCRFLRFVLVLSAVHFLKFIHRIIHLAYPKAGAPASTVSQTH
jgi:hypothetical protein